MVRSKITGKNPSFIEPALIHQDKKYGTYQYFTSEIKKIRPSTQNLMAIGADGEEALSSAFLSMFPNCVHLQCSLHKQENLLRKLCELKFDELKTKQILLDVPGSWIDDTYFEGLIDSADYKDFMEKVEMLHTKWDSLCPGFIDWFTGT